MTGLPADVMDRLAKIGREFTPETIEETRAMLVPLHEQAGYAAPVVVRDLAYGPHERHRLDVHAPAGQVPGGAPVLLFVHGGGFTGGDKHVPGSPYYDHLGGWAARHGVVAVTMNYRLAPGSTWPAGARDVGAALAWTRREVAAHGGNPDGVVLMGQSAGAAHAAGFLAGHAGPAADGRAGPEALAGAVLLSPVVEPATAGQDEMLHSYYGADPAQLAAASALPGLAASPVPLLAGVAELDTPDFHAQSVRLLAAVLAARGVIPDFVTVPGHTHISEIYSLGLDEDAFGAVLARFIHRVAGQRAG